MEAEIKKIDEKLIKLATDIELIKGLLMSKVDEEGELSDWAKNELEEARKTPTSECISHEELKKRIFRK